MNRQSRFAGAKRLAMIMCMMLPGIISPAQTYKLGDMCPYLMFLRTINIHSHYKSILIMENRSFFKVFILFLMLCSVFTVNAKSWRINNNKALRPNFTSINAAMSSEEVQDGDTLYLDPGSVLSEAQTVTKAVTIVGPGYLMSGIPYGTATITGVLYMNAIGCKIEGSTLKSVILNSKDVTIERCSATLINMNNQDNAIIRSCYMTNKDQLLKNGSNSTIENCILVQRFTPTSSPDTQRGSYDTTLNSFKYCVFRNNYIERYNTSTFFGYSSKYILTDFSNCEIINNIILNRSRTTYDGNIFNGTYTAMDDCTVYHNILSSSYDALYPYNMFNQAYNNIFAGGSGDKEFMLKSGCPAKEYATDGGDCGPYGSGYTYIPKGLPFGRPYYTKMDIVLPETDGILKVSCTTEIQDE